MKVTTWNVNGIRAREAQVIEFVERERPDLLCLQEIKASPEQVPAALRELADYWGLWHGYKGYSGVGLHLRKSAVSTRPSFFHPDFDTENRIVAAQLGSTIVASIYVPNGGRDYPGKVRFVEALDSWAEQCLGRGLNLLLCGDFNIARAERDVHPKLRKPTETGQTPEERAMLERLLDKGLVDVGRELAPDDDQLFTWWAPWRNLRARDIGWRLDYVLASGPLAARAISCVSEREFGTSDHAPVTVVFGFDRFEALGPAGAPA
jgi:exodeoxyribonuclease-3